MKRIDDLRAEALAGGGAKKIEQHHESGKLTARERVNLLLDPDSFCELGMFVTHRCNDFGMETKKVLGDGVVTGYGYIHGRLVYVIAEDFTVFGGSLSQAYAEKIGRIQDLALRNGAPVIGLKDSGGARIQEGVDSLAGYGDVFLRNVLASGVIPQISAVMGPCAGGAVYSPALTDFVFMVKQSSYMFLTGPDVIREVTHEEVTFEELGGAMVHNSRSGVAHFATESEEQCLSMIRELLTYLPQNNMEDPPLIESSDPADRMEDSLDSVVPPDPSKPYDMMEVLRAVVDDGRIFEVHREYAPSLIVGFARLGGRPVGLIANQPNHLAGVLDTLTSVKGARFIRFCDCFNIPLVVFEDAPGFLPGVSQEHSGVIKEGAKMLYAFCEATVPRLTVITRKAYGGAYIAMNSKHIRCDLNFAWPTAQIAVMGAEGAVKILFRRDIASDEDPAARRQLLVDEYNEKFNNPYIAANRGYIDEVIKPHETRPKLISALRSLESKRDGNPPKKHGNLPL
ncbi:acyl-CoA carboxylase subunit beta [Candidatus Fermentibacterales bacterium]|nr:acyl-CoA carboxylase subunit beta [Candidatus Fermentibacterales bacterium]